MMMKTLQWIAPSLFFVAGCASVSAGNAPTMAASDALCRQAIDWESSGNTQARRITPVVNEDEGGRSYHFDLGGRVGLQVLDASCGWGSYAECNFTARDQQGGSYEFTDFSTFALWEKKGELYLVYKIVSPTNEVAAQKRRVLKIASPPQEICNQIGDYSKLL